MKSLIKIFSSAILLCCLICVISLPFSAATEVVPVTLNIGDKTWTVLSYEYSVTQETYSDGQISGGPVGWQITIVIEKLQNSVDLLDWSINPDLKKDGEIVISNTVDGKPLKTISFNGADCIFYEENWTDGTFHTETIKLSCREIINNGVSFKNANKMSNSVGSIFSEGNIVYIIVGIVVVIAAAVIAAVVYKKKNKKQDA